MVDIEYPFVSIVEYFEIEKCERRDDILCVSKYVNKTIVIVTQAAYRDLVGRLNNDILVRCKFHYFR